MAQAKPKTTPAKRRRRSTPTVKGVQYKKITSDLVKPGGIIIGLVAGKMISDTLDGVAAKAGPVDGLAGDVKSALKPAIMTGGGLAASQLVKNEFIKYVFYGVSSYGGVTLAKEFGNFDVLSKIAPNSVNELGTVPFRYNDNPGQLPAKQIFNENDLPLSGISM